MTATLDPRVASARRRLIRSGMNAGIIARQVELFKNSVTDEPPHGPAQAQQHRELQTALEELRQREEELARLGAELQAFLSNVTHEFQTPLNSILALTRLLLDRVDGDLTTEQEKQVTYIRQATADLSQLVHDLLDLAKIEAGKVTLRPSRFTVEDLFSALRDMMRPLHRNDAVSLVFDPAPTAAPLFTDEGKVSQILRNYISNALKFTERGEIRVSAHGDDSAMITFRVTDTGIGIAREDQGQLFHQFGQVPNRLQARVGGTGLGLSLSKRLAELLGGGVGVQSARGQGSTFWVRLPMTAPGLESVADARRSATEVG